MLSEKPDIAQGYTKTSREDINIFWENVKTELNILGPPSKEATAWRKVWLDWKAYIKRKLVENKKDLKATGNGEFKQHHFSQLEEGVIELTGLKTSTEGITTTLSFGHTTCPKFQNSTQDKNKSSDHVDVDLDASMTSDRGMNIQNTCIPSTQRKLPDTAKLLEKQIEMQNNFYKKTMEMHAEQIKMEKELNQIGEELAINTKRLYRGIDKLCDLKKLQIEETRRHNKVQEELLKRKIEIKLKMLQIEEAKLDYRDGNDD